MPRRPVLFPEGFTEAEAWGVMRWFEEKGGSWLVEARRHAYEMGLVEGEVKGQSAPPPSAQP